MPRTRRGAHPPDALVAGAATQAPHARALPARLVSPLSFSPSSRPPIDRVRVFACEKNTLTRNRFVRSPFSSRFQNQLRAQAQEIGKLQGTVDSLHVENRDLRARLDAPPAGQILNAALKTFSGQEALRLESVEEKVHCNSYKSHTDARFRVFGAPGRFRGSFPDIHNAKIEIKTPEGLGEALTAAFQFKPLQPLSRATTRVSIDVGELLGFKGAPTLVLNPDPPFLGGLNVLGPLTGHQRSSAPIKWNPRLELSGVTDGGAEWEARYSVANDGAVLRAVEGEVRHAHPVYGDFALSRWTQEDDIERFKKYGEKYYRPAGSGAISRRALAAHERRVAEDSDTGSADTGGASTPRRTSPRRALWGGWLSTPAGGGRSGRSGRKSRKSLESRSGSRSGSKASRGSRGSRSYGSRSRGSSRASWFRHFGPPSPRWLASWRRDFAEVEVTAKVGDAVAVANERGHKHGGSTCASGGVVNSDAVWVTSDTWEAEISARRQLQHNLDGRIAARFVAREVEAGVSYHFTEEFKGWHVNAKTILSPQGINTPEFTLHHVWDF